jgi:A/G-specific adenine glycosylase
MVRERYQGSIPDNLEELLSLPGIGRSTAGAILSLAHGKKTPILDANIQRLLCRLSAVQEDPQKSHAKRLLWDLMERLLPEKETRLFNQGLMDIGALFCLPRSPRCRNCPLSSLCLAFARGIQDRIPPLKKARPLPLRERAVAIIWRKGDLLIHHRPSSGLLGGLWEFPGAYVDGAGSAFRLLSRMFEQECGLLIQVKEEMFSFLHEYTHFKEMIRVFSGDYQQGKDSLAEGFRWVRLEEIEQLPLSASHRCIAQKVSRLGGGQRTRTQMLPFQGGG